MCADGVLVFNENGRVVFAKFKFMSRGFFSGLQSYCEASGFIRASKT